MASKKSNSSTSSGGLVAWGAVAVAVVGSSLTWFSSYQSTKQAMTLSCIDRIDKQEAIVREKAAKFLSANGRLNSESGDERLSIDDTRPLVSATVSAAYELVAYAPGDLGEPTRGFAESLEAAVNNELNEIDHMDEIATKGRKNIEQWPHQFSLVLRNFEESRITCSK